MFITHPMHAVVKGGVSINELGLPSFGGFGTLLKLTCSENMVDARPSPNLCQQLATQSPTDWATGCCRDATLHVLYFTMYTTNLWTGQAVHCVWMLSRKEGKKEKRNKETAGLKMSASKYCAEELSLILSWAHGTSHGGGRGCVSCGGNNVSVINVSVLGRGGNCLVI